MPYLRSSHSLANLKWPFPKNPLFAENGDGCYEYDIKNGGLMSVFTYRALEDQMFDLNKMQKKKENTLAGKSKEKKGIKIDLI